MTLHSPAPVFSLQDAGVLLGHRVQALEGVTLSIGVGERVALVGSNGSGKSTLLRLLHALQQPSSGQVERSASAQHAMVFQRPYLLQMSVQSNIALALWLHGTPWRQALVKAFEVLESLGLQTLAGRNARSLSVGQLQRVALARAMALGPQVLLLDEPTASLDPHAKREMEALVSRIAAQPGMTLVFASHNLGQVKRLASRVIYLEHGRVLADLPVQDFFNHTVLPSRYPQAHLFVSAEMIT